MRLLLIRHAVTAETGSVLTGRLPGVSLSAAGADMASELAARLRSLKVAALYTSPIERCVETAQPLADAWRLTPVVNEGFVEVDYGRWSGRTLASLRRLKQWGHLFTAPSRFRFPDGESLGEMAARAVAACEALVAAHRKQTVAVVSHADVIRAIVSHYLGTTLDVFQRLDVLPASVSVVDLPAAGAPRVPVVNHVADVTRWR